MTDLPPPHAPKRIPIGAVIEQLQPDFPDLSVSKIRFLESRGLVTPWRSDSGFRRFDEDDVARLRWILTMQRDHFLPLRVIRERLDAGGDQPVPPDANLDRDAPMLAASVRPTHFKPAGPEHERLDAADLARLASLDEAQLDALIKFGLIDAIDTPEGRRFNRNELQVAKAASAFLRRGIEARHLKAWRVAAEREAGMVEQIVSPITHQSGADATHRARETADELIDMGNTIREAIMVKVLRPGLGFDD